ncbi:MAG: cyclic-phosphate processing receiver domain-containing protein [Planctomycetota bacterium]
MQPVIANTAEEMLALIEQHISHAFTISLDHDLHVPGVEDAGDGLEIAKVLASQKPACPVIIHTSNAAKSHEMQGVLEAEGWTVYLAGAIGEGWIESDWIHEVSKVFRQANA